MTALDPKYVELQAVATSGLGAVVTDVPAMPGVLESLVAELNDRCERMAGRSHLPSLQSPVRIVIVDIAPEAIEVIAPLWTVHDVAAYLRVPVQTVYAWRAQGSGPRARKVGKYLRYQPADVVDWFENGAA